MSMEVEMVALDRSEDSRNFMTNLDHETEAPVTIMNSCSSEQTFGVEQIPKLRHMIAQDPECSASWLRLGKLHAESGNTRTAADAFAQALCLNSDCVEARVSLADAQSKLGEFIDALQTCIQGLELQEDDVELLHALARILIKGEAYTQAEDILAKARSIDPNHLDTALQTAFLRARQNRPDEAMRILDGLLEKVPSHIAVRELRSEVQLATVRGTQLREIVPRSVDRSDHACEVKWKRILAPWPGFKVGLLSTSARRLPLEISMALADVPGATFFGIFPEVRAHGVPHLAMGAPWIPLSDLLEAPADVDAASAQMDLVICVDLESACRAAELGCRTWGILPKTERPAVLSKRRARLLDSDVRLFPLVERGKWNVPLGNMTKALTEVLHLDASGRLSTQQESLLQAALAQTEGRVAEAEKIYRHLLSTHQPMTDDMAHAMCQFVLRRRRTTMLRLLKDYRGATTKRAQFLAEDLRATLTMVDGNNELAFAIWESQIASGIAPIVIYQNYASAAATSNQFERSVRVCNAGLFHYPACAPLHWRAALGYKAMEKFADEKICLNRLVELTSAPTASLRLAWLLLRENQPNEAKKHVNAALAEAPNIALGWELLGKICNTLFPGNGSLIARMCFQHACELRPSYNAYSQLARCFSEAGLYQESLGMFDIALTYKPNDADSLFRKAYACDRLSRDDDAIHFYEKALNVAATDENFVRATKGNLIWLYLKTEQWEKGYDASAYMNCATRSLPKPEWNGESLAGKTLLVYQGHGYGDSIQLIRLLPQLKPGKLIYAVFPALVSLYQGFPGIDEVISLSDGELEKLTYDYQAAEFKVFNTLRMEPKDISVKAPYLNAAAAPVARWKEALKTDRNFKIGIAWSGNPAHIQDKHRSTSLEDWLPLAKLSNVSLYNLQKNKDREALFDLPKLNVRDFTDSIGDFAELASFMSNMDLIVTIDSAPAHLAGALGLPVWLLLNRSWVDWRWLANGSTSLWYPSMRIFRQEQHQNWGDMLASVCIQVGHLITERSNNR